MKLIMLLLIPPRVFLLLSFFAVLWFGNAPVLVTTWFGKMQDVFAERGAQRRFFTATLSGFLLTYRC